MEAIDELTADLGWRETELALLKVFFQRKDVTQRQHDVLARAAWSLLYAHYEGYAKFCLTLFFDRAARLVGSCRPLPKKTKEYALFSEMKRIRQLPTVEFLETLETFGATMGMKRPDFPEVDTKSNLWPNVLEDLLAFADIKCPSVDKNRILLKALVSKRNKIAHGQSVSASYPDYLEQERAVYEVMYDIAYQVDARLKCDPFTIA
ncbi:MAE_28990/MAE_18760 family HEPN-like nuclease [Rhizobium sp. CC-YZS058]|uniref:MAE_28990/MAE_18760 family HEPN-like nuclease n=1 Tax=Rhizobium sp. CC-YZS058 TaxID=3042153 RepID=UPI002B058BDD|nr:MAE_28990/MAE_18760 family HEPN-like nuclease [Rhizobium sp. CC-YZS058]MEA3535630.1 MAE_28990/MAE_18760 family HEPN-like nuclease [Rhizobium sp. CC-YZS058]